MTMVQATPYPRRRLRLGPAGAALLFLALAALARLPGLGGEALLLQTPLPAPWLAGVLAVAVTAFALRGLVLALGGGMLTGFAAGLFLVAYSVLPGGLAGGAAVLSAPFLALGAWLLLGEARQLRTSFPPRLTVLGLAGLLCGVAGWVRPGALAEALALWAVVAGIGLASGAAGSLRILATALVFGATCALPWVARPGQEALLPSGFGLAELGTAAVQLPWLLAAAVLPLLLPGPGRRTGLMLAPWLLAAALSAAWPAGDHALVLLPPAAAMAALGIARVIRRLAQPEARRGLLAGSALALAAAPVLAMLATAAQGQLAGTGWHRAQPAGLPVEVWHRR